MSELTSHLTAGVIADAPPVFADEVHFASPLAHYRDRETIDRIFSLMPSVFDELSVVRELCDDDGEVATVMHGRVGDHPVDLILDECRDGDGLVREATLFLRPLAGMVEAIDRIKAAFRASSVDRGER